MWFIFSYFVAGPNEYPSPLFQNPRPWIGPMSDRYTRDSVRRQHKQMVAEKHTAIMRNRPRPASASTKKGLVKVGPQKSKGVLICRPASANPVFYNIPNRNNNKFMKDSKMATRGRSWVANEWCLIHGILYEETRSYISYIYFVQSPFSLYTAIHISVISRSAMKLNWQLELFQYSSLSGWVARAF